jgi:NAD(P)-dependent dehydrogenase (short-subunit alcohol dehydrogenase family)
MNMDFTNHIAVVTGGGRGIGGAIAKGLLERGAEVLITSTGSKPEWTNRYPKCRHLTADFKKPSDVDALITLVSSLSKIDILVNNVGSYIPETIDVIKLDHWHEVLNVNLTIPMRLMQIAALKMKASKSGKIINISSIAAFVSRPSSGGYSSSKCALTALTRSVAMDLAKDGVLVNSLCPGHTQTDMMDTVLNEEQRNTLRAPIPMGRFANPDEIAHWALFLTSPLNTYITAQSVIVDGGVTIQ